MSVVSPSRALDHTLVFYRGETEFLEQLVPFVREGVAAGESVTVAVPNRRLASLATHVGDLGPDVQLADMTELGRNPGALISSYQRILLELGGRPSRLIGEFDWEGRTGDGYAALVEHEALVNMAFADQPLRVRCLYDSQMLPPDVVSDARCAHPRVCERGRIGPSDEYAPDRVLARRNTARTVPDDAVVFRVMTSGDLRDARRSVREHLRAQDLPDRRIADTEMAVTELATNSLTHAADGCRIALWLDHGDIVATVEDAGHLAEPLAGRRIPDPGAPGGRGLLVLNHLARLVRIHTTPTSTTVQARF